MSPERQGLLKVYDEFAKRARIPMKDARNVLAMVPGINYPAGTTYEDILKMMEDAKLVTVKGDWVYLSDSNTKEIQYKGAYPKSIQRLRQQLDEGESFFPQCFYFAAKRVLVPFVPETTEVVGIWFLTKWEYFDGERSDFYIREGYHRFDWILPKDIEENYSFSNDVAFYTGELNLGEVKRLLKKTGFQEKPEIIGIWEKWIRAETIPWIRRELPELLRCVKDYNG